MSDVRSRLESTALIAALVLVAAFATSAIVGVLHRPAAPAIVAPPGKPLPAPPGKMLGRVEVLNATGRSGLARAATEQLRNAGYDVVFFGTNRTNTDSSLVIDRIGRHDIADGVARVLGITAVRTNIDPTALLDATVVVGNDWRERQVEQQAVTETGWKAKLRKWFGR